MLFRPKLPNGIENKLNIKDKLKKVQESEEIRKIHQHQLEISTTALNILIRIQEPDLRSHSFNTY